MNPSSTVIRSDTAEPIRRAAASVSPGALSVSSATAIKMAATVIRIQASQDMIFLRFILRDDRVLLLKW